MEEGAIRSREQRVIGVCNQGVCLSGATLQWLNRNYVVALFNLDQRIAQWPSEGDGRDLEHVA